MSRRVVIIGAGGRDFHNFNIFFRDNPDYHVVAFIHVSQIPGLKSRRYPSELAGSLYPEGIPIYTEKDLEKIIRENKVDEAVISYSDLSYKELGNIISRVIASGSSVRILGPDETFHKIYKTCDCSHSCEYRIWEKLSIKKNLRASKEERSKIRRRQTPYGL